MRLNDLVLEYKEPIPAVIDEASADPVDLLLAQVDMGERSPAQLLKEKVDLDLPVADMVSVRKVADRLDFAMIPIEALSPESWKTESEDMRAAIHGFNRVAKTAGLSVYALTPSIYFSLQAYLDRCNGAVCYGGGKARAFNSLNLTAGMLVSLHDRMEVLDKNMGSLADKQDKDFKTLSSAINKTNRRVDDLDRRVSQVEERRAEAERERERLIAAAWERYQVEQRMTESYRMDPFLFAIDGNDPGTAEVALAGPCWGPDLSPDLLRKAR
jgi:hypothetical protein